MGSGRAGRAALHPGDWCGRGMGWLSPVVDGVGTQQQKSGAYSIMAAIRRPRRRLLPRQPRDIGVQCDVGGSVLELGMRVPFWLSLIMVGIGLWIRLGILETPIFRGVIAEERVARAPVVEVLKRQPKEVILVALARMGQMAPAFVYGAFIFTYGTKVVGASRDFLLIALLIGSFVSFFTIPFSGYLSDRLGRRQVYMFGAAATGLFAFAYYALLNTAVPGLIVLAVVVSFFFHDLMWGPLAALTAECFTPRLRYSGASIGFQLAAVFAGGPAPMIATAILASTGSGQMIALYILGCAIVSIAATAF